MLGGRGGGGRTASWQHRVLITNHVNQPAINRQSPPHFVR
eukprot:COSAG01_NODE_67834_length_266_cov_0.263473_1_plen_39_part_10